MLVFKCKCTFGFVDKIPSDMDRVWIWTEYGLDMKGLDHFISLIVNDSWHRYTGTFKTCKGRREVITH